MGFSQRAALLNPETADATKVAASAVERSVAAGFDSPVDAAFPEACASAVRPLRMKMLFTTKYVVPTTSSAGATRLEAHFLLAHARRGGRANVHRLEKTLALRRSVARLLGFGSWAALQLDTRMAKSPDRVLELLRDVDARLLGKARQEIGDLARREGHSIEAWDYDRAQEGVDRSIPPRSAGARRDRRARRVDAELPGSAVPQRCVLRRIGSLTAAVARSHRARSMEFCTGELCARPPKGACGSDGDPRARTSRNRIAEWYRHRGNPPFVRGD